MKAAGMVRPIDNLGRVVLPKELRKLLGMLDGDDSVEVFVDGNQIVMQKYEPAAFSVGTSRTWLNWTERKSAQSARLGLQI